MENNSCVTIPIFLRNQTIPTKINGIAQNTFLLFIICYILNSFGANVGQEIRYIKRKTFYYSEIPIKYGINPINTERKRSLFEKIRDQNR